VVSTSLLRWAACTGVILALTVAARRPACAQTASTQSREADARKACLTGDYQRGAALLAELFADTGEATYIYNQARCYQQNGRPDEAINHFREYLRVAKNLPADVIAETEAHIREMEAMKAAAGAHPPATTPEPATPPPITSPPPSPSVAPSAELSSSPEPAEPRGRRLRIAGLAVGAVGAVAFVGGVLLGVQAQNLSDDVHNRYSQDAFDRGQRAGKLQWVGYGLGIAGLATGAVLFVMGRSADAAEHAQAPRALALVPLLSPGLAGAMVRTGF